jgi:hypothetical protein
VNSTRPTLSISGRTLNSTSRALSMSGRSLSPSGQGLSLTGSMTNFRSIEPPQEAFMARVR